MSERQIRRSVSRIRGCHYPMGNRFRRRRFGLTTALTGGSSGLMSTLMGEQPDWSLCEFEASPEKQRLLNAPAIQRPSQIGRYNILGSIGEGGMGIVYLAEHSFSEQRVALKVIIPNQASKNAIDSFVREVRLLARFNHRGIARLLDADTFEADGTHYPYFVMELIEGAKKMTDFVRDAGCDERRRLELILQTAAAVAQTHRVKVVHGDIKPSNVLVGLDGEVKVVDFGAAVDGAAGDDTLRALTLAYAAPEQVEQMRAVLASDVYSLAILAYEILTGCRPDGSPIRVERTIMGAPDCRTSPPITAPNGGASEGTEQEGGLGNDSLPAAIKAIPIRLLNRKINKKTERVLLHALAQKPEHRYPDAEVFRNDLEASLRGGLLSIEEGTLWNRAWAFRAEHRGLVAAVLIVIAVLLMGIAGTAWKGIEARDQANKASQETANARRESAKAELAVTEERAARQITEELKRDTDEASLFVLHLLSSSGIFSAQDGPERVKKIIDAAESGLKRSGLSKQFGAAIYHALGNVMRDLHRYDEATNWLRQAEAIWRELDRDPKYGSSGKAPMRRELARALDSLAWAELGDKHQTNGQPERASRAAAAAWKAYEILKELDGEADDSALCAYGDWLEMNAFATGDILALVNGYIVQFATAMGVDRTKLKHRMVQSLKETARRAQAKEAEEAREEVRRFLAPLVTEQRKAFRVRMPFALAQLAEKIGKPEWGVPLALLFRLSAKEIAAVRLPFAEVADEMTEWNPGNRPRVRAILDKVRQEVSTPATQQSAR